ncbi:MAG: GNAT family N-acetyltransferase, partial [Hyphomicrobiaceae bacterium]
MPWPEAIELHGDIVSVVPLTRDHCASLKEAAADGDLHRLWYTSVPAPEAMTDDIEKRLSMRESGFMLPFSVIDRGFGKPIGMTTYLNIDEANRRLEIGATWYRQSVQRSGLNTECKFLLLQHAFETLDCIAVEFRTHFMNRQSRRAIERLGAKLDGVLRNHTIMPNGT